MGFGEGAVPPSKPMSIFEVEEFRQYAHRMVDFIANYYRDIAEYPVRSQVQPGYLKPQIPKAAPEDPESLDDVLADVQSKIIPGVTHWQSPSFFAYYPSNASTAAYLGEMLSGGFNIVGFSWISSPAATELENVVLDWLGKLLRLPEEFLSSGGGGGVIQGTASEAVCVAMLAARKRSVAKLMAEGASETEAFGRLTAYVSDQTHVCVQKAAQIAGVAANLRVLPTDSSTNFTLSPAALRKAVAEDAANGFEPFFLCGTVGTTSSSAVDSVSELGDIALEHGMWFHVDAAYAGNACICPEFRHNLDGIEKADSYCMNPHKWLLTNFDCSTLWLKDPRLLVAAMSTSPEYLRNKATDEKLVVDYKDWQLPLGRRFRSLKLWFIMRLYGASGLRNYIRKHILIAKHLESLVQTSDRFEMVAPRNFSLICFRLKPLENDTDNGKTVNATLLEAINSRGDCFLTHTVLDGVFTLRMAVGSTRTELQHVNEAWTVINTEADRLIEQYFRRLAT
ncbi:hypothetical protein Mapa_000667 [Marchantia paleacea]|nr:hypothetical protein Mapa_000667 [Marchantia paleacea]